MKSNNEAPVLKRTVRAVYGESFIGFVFVSTVFFINFHSTKSNKTENFITRNLTEMSYTQRSTFVEDVNQQNVAQLKKNYRV